MNFVRQPAHALTALVLCLAPMTSAAQTAPGPAVTVAAARMMDVDTTAAFNGRAVAVQKVEIRARVEGFLVERGFDEGRPVKQGAVLFRIDDALYRAKLAQAEAAVTAAAALMKLANIELTRQSELVQRGAAPQAQVDRAEAEASRASAEVDRLSAMRDVAGLDVSYTSITAPFDGVVGLSAFDIGALIGPTSGSLLTLVRQDPMTVEFPVPEREFLQDREAKRTDGRSQFAVTLRLSDGRLLTGEGKIDFADASVSLATDTVMVRAVFANPEGLLRDGSLVSVNLKSEGSDQELAIPQQALQGDVTGSFVLVVAAEGTVSRRPVIVSRVAAGLAVITEGLNEGERVITEGINKARPGAIVDAALAEDE